jgi:branched-subunit amino acid transport protein AzlD
VRQQSPQIRQSIERLSLRPAAYLRQLPRWLPPVVIAALFVGGLAVLSWPALAPQTRLLRVVALAVLLALCAWQALR